jgi:type 1 glutamine amidotransferase
MTPGTKNLLNIRILIPGALLIIVSAAASFRFNLQVPSSGAGPIRVLILSGQNNHDWKTTTPKLKAILEENGLSRIDILEDPAGMTGPGLEPYDVILSNWNAFGLDPNGAAWPETARQAYLDFIRRGKGHVVVHAGSSSFPEWKEYGRLVLAGWKNGQTSHGPKHEFRVRIDDLDHPVTAGLEPFNIADELWIKPGLEDRPSVLASSYSDPGSEGAGSWEPAVLAGRFGEGRTFTLLLGHDAEAMANPGFRALLRRGVEWAARGRVAPPSGTAAQDWVWEKKEGSSLALTGPSGTLWRFRYDAALDMPYFHPLNSSDGQTITADRPLDHLWHHGLWFSWKFINKVNYWEIDPKTLHPAGRTSWSEVRIAARDDHTARITMDVAYRPAGVKGRALAAAVDPRTNPGALTRDANTRLSTAEANPQTKPGAPAAEDTPVLTEKRTIEISAPDPEGVYAIDWTGAFTAVHAVVLDRTPLPGEPGGQAYGGYAGLSLRLALKFDDRQAMTSDGPISEMKDGRYRGKHTALDYSGLLDGRPVGVAICDHPQNPRTPTPWYVIRSAEMSFFAPALLCYGPLELKPGERITLRYRVLVHSGRWDAARLRTEYERFSKSRMPPSNEKRP